MSVRLSQTWKQCVGMILVVGTLATYAAAAQSSEVADFIRPLLAQGEGNNEFGESSSAFSLNDPALFPWYKGVGTGVGVLLTFFIAWYLIYPSVLRRGSVWPVTLFGRCTAIAWVASWAIGLSVYWDKLEIGLGETWARGWGLRIACVGVAALVGTLCLVYWRSESPTKAS